MRLVGLTGGIASGKSTVSNLFKSHGFPVVDADLVARYVLKKDTGGYNKVVAAFGEEILEADGEVDRPKLGRIVFSDNAKRQVLNRLLAPYISSGIFCEILKLWLKGYKVIVLDIPLLFETKMDKWTKPVVVVWVDTETQLQRLMARDGSTEEDARNRINAQMAMDLKRSKADIVIDNTGSLEDLEEQFRKIGDETFIIAALMAMRHPKSIVLSGALTALIVMTVLSTGLGRIVPNLISRKHTNSAATVLYAFFGLRLLYIAWRSDSKSSQKKEMEESFILTFLAEWGDRSQIATIAV
ncbi:hypothetical protein GH714_017020 [Hevea brasiliensis]|uniref:GDT1 family protein n=1 Tax=Hevea brasiliensis TaxID=3981 RepID=A0A6A6KG10_HEVBR|nr:hypothetical protein GH714_017020 [Hevea brasiliensis]